MRSLHGQPGDRPEPCSPSTVSTDARSGHGSRGRGRGQPCARPSPAAGRCRPRARRRRSGRRRGRGPWPGARRSPPTRRRRRRARARSAARRTPRRCRRPRPGRRAGRCPSRPAGSANVSTTSDAGHHDRDAEERVERHRQEQLEHPAGVAERPRPRVLAPTIGPKNSSPVDDEVGQHELVPDGVAHQRVEQRREVDAVEARDEQRHGEQRVGHEPREPAVQRVEQQRARAPRRRPGRGAACAGRG